MSSKDTLRVYMTWASYPLWLYREFRQLLNLKHWLHNRGCKIIFDNCRFWVFNSALIVWPLDPFTVTIPSRRSGGSALQGESHLPLFSLSSFTYTWTRSPPGLMTWSRVTRDRTISVSFLLVISVSRAEMSSWEIWARDSLDNCGLEHPLASSNDESVSVSYRWVDTRTARMTIWVVSAFVFAECNEKKIIHMTPCLGSKTFFWWRREGIGLDSNSRRGSKSRISLFSNA